jgi:hypothetical protein
MEAMSGVLTWWRSVVVDFGKDWGTDGGNVCDEQVLGMASTIDPALVKVCDEIAARGGPPRLPGVVSGVLVPVAAPPVVRASARLRGFQPEVDALKSSEGNGRRTRRSSEGLLPGTRGVGGA